MELRYVFCQNKVWLWTECRLGTFCTDWLPRKTSQNKSEIETIEKLAKLKKLKKWSKIEKNDNFEVEEMDKIEIMDKIDEFEK